MVDDLGTEELERPAQPVSRASDDQVALLHRLVAESGMTPELLTERLAVYDAAQLEDLSAENADMIITKLTTAAAANGCAATTPNKEENDA